MTLADQRQADYGDAYATAKRYDADPFAYPLAMARAKVARLQHNPRHEDSWRDLLAYAQMALDFMQRER